MIVIFIILFVYSVGYMGINFPNAIVMEGPLRWGYFHIHYSWVQSPPLR